MISMMATTAILGIKVSVISLIEVTAWNIPTVNPTSKVIPNRGEAIYNTVIKGYLLTYVTKSGVIKQILSLMIQPQDTIHQQGQIKEV